MGHEAAEGDAASPKEQNLTSRARGEFPKVWQCLGEAADGSGSLLLYSQTPLNHHLPEARLQFRASPLPFSIVIGTRMPGHEGGSRKPEPEMPLDKSSIIPYKWVKDTDMTSKEILEKVKEMLEINTRVNWDGQWMEKRPVTANEEFQNILDEIEKMEK